MARYSLHAALALLLLAAPAAAQDPDAAEDAPPAGPPAWVWNRYTDTSVAFGVPDTDERAVRIDCEGGKTLVLIAPVDPQIARSDGRINVLLVSPAGMDMMEGDLVELGDGPNFRALLPSPSDGMAALMAGDNVTLGLLGEERVIPGAGAAAVLGPLIKACGG